MNYIYIVNLGKNKYSKYCIDSWKIWGRRYNIEVIEYNLDVNPSIEPHWMKVFAMQVLLESEIEFDKIAIVDNDTIVNPKCPNFFESIEPNEIGITLDDTDYDWIIRSIEAYHKNQFSDLDTVSPFEYFNSGFIVLDKSSIDLYKDIGNYVLANYTNLNSIQNSYGVGRDQTVLNFLIRKYIKEKYNHLSLRVMDIRYNVQGLISKKALNKNVISEYTYVTHFNAMDRDYRNMLMDELFNMYYG